MRGHLLIPQRGCVLSQGLSCPTLCDPLDCSLPGSSVHGILQARILAWVAVPSSRGSSPPRDQIPVSRSPALAGSFFTIAPPQHEPLLFSEKQKEPCFTKKRKCFWLAETRIPGAASGEQSPLSRLAACTGPRGSEMLLLLSLLPLDSLKTTELSRKHGCGY